MNKGFRSARLDIAFALIFGGMAFGGYAQQVGIQAEDLHRLSSIGDVQISPNGESVLYTEVDRSPERSAQSALRIIELATGASRVFRSSGAGGSSPRWSPDGSHVALVGRHGDKFGLVVADAAGENERFIAEVFGTNHPLPSSGERLSWGPKGNRIAFISSVAGPETDEANGDPVVIRRYLYKPTASEGMTRFNDNRRMHIFVAELANDHVVQLTDGDFYEHSIDFSPDGEEILFVSNREPNPDRFFNYDLFAVAVEDRSVRRITRTENAEYRPRWSPDGRQIVYQGTTRGLTSSETTMEDTHLWLIDARGEESQELVSLDNRQGAPRWTNDGRYVYFTVQESGSVGLHRISIGGGEVESVYRLDGSVRSFSVSNNGVVAFGFHSPTDMPQLFVDDGTSATGASQVTDTNRELLSRRTVAPTINVDYLSFDGMPVQAFLTLPLRNSSNTSHPMIAKIKGGPHGQRGPAFDHKAQVYAAEGWATLQVNYRGSTGYGQAFADAIFGDQDGGEAKDVIYAVQAVLRRYDYIDRNRLGIEGGSYGGQLTNWIITQTDMFRAAIPIAGISNLISFNYMAYYHDYLAVEFGAYPHQDDLMDTLWERSPLKHVAKVRTPVMLVHGENDNDVPIAEAEQFYVALHDVGVEAVMIRYPREGHGIRETGHSVDLAERSMDWYASHFFEDVASRDHLRFTGGTNSTEAN